MGNEISDELRTGTIGELLVQLRLLQFGVQAAPPLKDTGNDLIAVRGESFRSVQVKTSKKSRWKLGDLPEHYHIVALVNLIDDGTQLLLDQSSLWLVPREIVEGEGLPKDLNPYLLGQELIDKIWQ